MSHFFFVRYFAAIFGSNFSTRGALVALHDTR